MDKERKLLIALDLVTLLVIFLVVVAVLFPIWSVTNFYPFYRINIAFVAIFLLAIRYLFGVQHSFIAYRQPAKVVLMLLMFPVVFLLINKLNVFMSYIEDQTFAPITGHLPEADRMVTDKYIWNEMLFFGVGSIISCILLPFRLFRSIWRNQHENAA